MSARSYGLAGRTALVTGAAQGIGFEIATQLAAEGVKVAINGRTPEKVERAVAEIRASGGQAVAAPARVEDRDEVGTMVEDVFASLGSIDFLVNNAGISRPAPFLELSEESWDSQLDINLKGAFLCGQAAARRMLERGRGAIVNLGSIASFGGQEGRAAYAASKAGLIGLTRVMAQELSPHGIRVNAIAPSLIGTELVAAIVPPKFRDEVALDRTPLGRLGEPSEVAETVLFLLSDGAAYITGETIRIDGGLLSGYYYSASLVGRSFR
jgi:3-oxoacyl-[acyl-carrier protein] reductase